MSLRRNRWESRGRNGPKGCGKRVREESKDRK
jgi:hypothetical protein